MLTVVARHPDTVWIDEGDRIVVVPMPSGSVHFLIGPAVEVWRLCLEPVARSEVGCRVVAAYSDAPPTAVSTLEPFIDMMVTSRLLIESPQAE